MSKKLLLPMMVVNQGFMSCCGRTRTDCTCGGHDDETSADLGEGMIVGNVPQPRTKSRQSTESRQSRDPSGPLDVMTFEDIDAEEREDTRSSRRTVAVNSQNRTGKKPQTYLDGPLPCPGDPGYLT